jgi:signal transduction histidine kinase
MVHAEQVTAPDTRSGAAEAALPVPTSTGSGTVAGLAGRAWPVAAALVGVAGEAVAIGAAPGAGARWNEVAVAAVVVAYAAVGVLILWHRPGHPVGRIAIGIASVWGVGEALVAASYLSLTHDPHSTVAALASAGGSLLRGLPWLVAVLWLPLVFPDGRRSETRLARVAGRVVTGTITLFSAVTLLSPQLSDLRVERIDNPIGAPHAAYGVFQSLAGLSLLFGVASIALAVAVLVQRYRHTGALGRQQTLVFAIAFVPPVAAFVFSFSDAAGPWLFGVASIPVPLAIGVSVLQRRLYDIPLVLNRSLTYGTLWLLIAALYAVTVGGVGAMLQQQDATWLSWAAAGVVAASFAPLREGLQRAANRITYGQWAQPTEVLSRTSRRLADAGDVRGLLGSLADELAVGLGLGFVEIRDASGSTLAVSGEVGGETDELPLTAYGAPVGVLRWRRRPLRESDRVLLADLAAQLGSVVHADGLLASVRAAQERLVLAREEERRRLRRDLHDGLGPALAGLTLQVDTVRNQVGSADVDAALLGLRGGIQDTVLDVRRIVEGLRPAALDDLGLVEAVRQLAVRMDPPVSVAADELPRLPAAVELAAYRIVQEALSNAARHATASRVCVGLVLGAGGLVVTVADDGTGVVVPRADGVGLGSMRERAEEIGGSFALAADPGRGTTVTATLPVHPRPVHPRPVHPRPVHPGPVQPGPVRP